MSEADLIAQELGWVKGIDFPDWANTVPYLKTISKGYVLKGETPRDAYKRVTTAVAGRLGKPELAEKFFDFVWKGWLNLASPVLANTGTTRGLPISCFVIDPEDSIHSIGMKNHELMMLAKHGGGVGIGINRIRKRGSEIKNNGVTEGVVPFSKIFDSTILATNQGGTRKGAASTNMNIMHGDFLEWLETREPKGDVNRQLMNLHQCAVIDDKFMRSMEAGDPILQSLYVKLIQKRLAKGEPYIMYRGNVNKALPDAYFNHNLKVRNTNICTEVLTYTDENHTTVCCLSSVNLAKYDEWKDTDLIYWATWFLDGVLEEFIQRAKGMVGFENAIRFAEKSRSIGLGVLGWHTFLQKKMLPFIGVQATAWTRMIFNKYKQETERASRDLAKEYGEPEWCRGTGMRNTHLRAIAPTLSNALLSGDILITGDNSSGGVSPSIEPWPSNVFTQQTAKGTFIRKNPVLEELLHSKDMNNRATWNQILADKGSVQNLECLSDEEKEVFLTAKEINQMELVRQAAVRGKYVDHGVSLNLFFPTGVSPKFVVDVHMEAWRLGIKTLYYVRTESVLRGDIATKATAADCTSCDG
jgi:ribonucleoside-diphosphate reductase alpha chain